MAGAPVAVLDHELIWNMEAMHKGWGDGQKDSFWASDDCRATTVA